MSITMSNKELATRLARDIFACGNNGPSRPVVRLQYRIGSLTGEKPGGGFIEPAFARFIEDLLGQYETKSSK
jgi:hypothetical protein